MADEIALVLFGGADLGTGNDGAGEGRPEQVAILVDSVALDSAEDNLLDKLLLQVFDDHLLGAEREGLALNGGEVLLLANVGEEALQFWSGTGEYEPPGEPGETRRTTTV